MRSPLLALSGTAAMLGVAMGAFGAHGLKSVLTPELLEVYKTAVSYQMWHALGLGMIAIVRQQSAKPGKLLQWAGCLMTIGILLFSGSLYGLTLSGAKWLGMITPFGGLAFIAAWSLLIIYAIRPLKES